MGNHTRKAWNAIAAAAALRWPRIDSLMTLRVTHEATSPPRGFARCRRIGYGVVVEVSPHLELEPQERFWGVLAHELGHAIALLLDVHPEDHRLGELLADELGGLVLGARVGYDHLGVQVLGSGAGLRPLRLDDRKF